LTEHVYEARRDNQSPRIDHPLGLGALEIPDPHNSIALHSNIVMVVSGHSAALRPWRFSNPESWPNDPTFS